MSKKVLISALIIVVLGAASQVQAALKTWDGPYDHGEGNLDYSWHTLENWDPDGVPGTDDDVVIDAGTGVDSVEINLGNWNPDAENSNIKILSLDTDGEVELGAWGVGWMQFTITYGLTNEGDLEINTDGWIRLIADVMNYGDMELEGVEVEGTFDNEEEATVIIWREAEITDDLFNGGLIEIDPFSEMWVEGELNNNGIIQLYGGIVESEDLLNNTEGGTIIGFGMIGSEISFINTGDIIAEGGVLVLWVEGTFVTTGELSNEFTSSLQIDTAANVNNDGTMYVKGGGGIAINNDLINTSTIELMGGTLAAYSITQSAGATFSGAGTIAARDGLTIKSGATIELTGPTSIYGDVTIDSGGTLIVRAGQTIITGATTNNGSIIQAGGTVLFQGGYSGSGEVSVPPADNVAFNKATTQSNTAFGGVAGRAVDGNTDGDWAQNSVTCTNNELNSWWQVDLGTTYNVSAIEVWNRTGYTKNRLDDFYVFVSDTPFASTDLTTTLNDSSVWSMHVAAVPDPQILLPVGLTGRYVRIQLGDTNYLSLAEVKVFGEIFVPSGANVAFNKTASQSNTSFGGVPNRAVDGNTDGDWAQNSITCTNNQLNPWWQVDLGTTYDLNGIEVWNRTDSSMDRLDNFYIFVSDTPFTSTNLATTLSDSGVWRRHVTTVPDPQVLLAVGRTGRYVRIQLDDTNYLILAEVKVFGETFVP